MGDESKPPLLVGFAYASVRHRTPQSQSIKKMAYYWPVFPGSCIGCQGEAVVILKEVTFSRGVWSVDPGVMIKSGISVSMFTLICIW